MARGSLQGTTQRQCTRHVATATKPRSTKKGATPTEDTVAVAKKSLSTKSPATATTKTPRKKKADVAVSEPLAVEGTLVTPKKTTRAASTKTTAAAPKKKAEAKTTTWTRTEAAPAEPRPTISPRSRPAPAQLAGNATPTVAKPVDVTSSEYKTAARKWTSLMVALPILAVSSYYLYDRIVLGNEPKGLETLRKKASSPLPPQPETSNS
ncbi:hypothetical protein B0T16DRAFT_456498 [Cercophora newfieldiana]|uniref:Uncharacterized protein n=1 Tax=Cercophora newfieldiana TaxID=92897 RepID=A0AA39YDK7_9PEZI|nr:hypothetical protein B0T16DRAFT_456498 [Cercophora newfieldiana]